MEITGYSAYNYMSQGTTTTTTEDSNSLGKDQFLQLLATQLKYQDPLNPMSNDQFIAQMAQFSSLEQVQNLNNTMETYVKGVGNLGVMNLLGTQITAAHKVTAGSTTTVEEVTGIVSSIDLSGSEPKLTTLDGKTAYLSEVKSTTIPTVSS